MKTRQPSPRPSDPEGEARARRVELLISNLLRIGVTVSLALVVIGTLITFFHHPDYASSHADFEQLTGGDAVFAFSVHDVVAGVLALRGTAIVTVGLLLLIATPIMRVAVSILAFVYQKDRVYTLITLTVLCLLLLSFLLGKVE